MLRTLFTLLFLLSSLACKNSLIAERSDEDAAGDDSACLVEEDCDGAAENSSSGSDSEDSLSLTVEPFYSVLPTHNWNYYVVEDGSAACDAGVGDICIHAGEKMKVVVPFANSCTGLSISDSLSAFYWECVDTGNAYEFRSIGLQREKNLSDLIKADGTGFRPMTVTVSDGSTSMTSDSEVWWANSFYTLPTSGALTNQGGIYVMTSDITNSVGYDLQADNIAIVALNDSEIVADIASMSNVCSGGSIRCIIGFAANIHHQWIEARVDGNHGNIFIGPMIQVGRYAHIRNTIVENLAATGGAKGIVADDYTVIFKTKLIDLEGGANSTAISGQNLIVDQVDGANLEMQNCPNGGDNTVMTNLYLYNSSCSNNGISIFSDAVVTMTMNANGGSTFRLRSSESNSVVMNVGAYSSTDDALDIASDDNYIDNFVSLNITGRGLYISGANNRINNFTAGDLGDHGVVPTATTIFSGELNLGTVTGNLCNAAADNLTTTTCVPTGANAGLVTLTTGLTMSTFNGFSTKTTETAITNWDPGERYQGWGLIDAGDDDINEATGLDQYARSYCYDIAAAECAIFDWSLATSDTLLLNTLACPSGTATYTHTWSDTTTSTFVLNAVEILFRGGNNNGLCEDNEICLFMPNKGAYQGHGNLVPATTNIGGGSKICSDIDGSAGNTVKNVTLLKYENNAI